MPKLAAASTLAILAFSLGSACRAQEPAQAPMDMSAMDSTDQHATQAAHEAMSGSMAADPHLTLTPTRPGTGADTARAAALVLEMRRALERYGDVRSAEAGGFRRFLPGVRQPVYHYTSWRSALAAQFRFDAVRPTSLLYKEGPRGTLVLVGAMYTAPARASFDELDRRVPLAVARWHEHVNWCLPPRGQSERWRETRDGKPVFGPKSPIATEAACSAVGGRFVPRLFGWMVHVMAFESDDPKIIWGGEHEHGRQ